MSRFQILTPSSAIRRRAPILRVMSAALKISALPRLIRGTAIVPVRAPVGYSYRRDRERRPAVLRSPLATRDIEPETVTVTQERTRHPQSNREPGGNDASREWLRYAGVPLSCLTPG